MIESNEGINKLAGVFQERIHKINDKPPVLDFGEVGADRSLLTNKFPKPIPFGDYVTCFEIPAGLSSPIRVLVAFVGGDAVVISEIFIP